MGSKSVPYRPNDYIYDPLFMVSGAQDYRKAADKAKMQTADFQVCPVYANMFSDLPHHPCKRLIIRNKSPPPTFKIYRKNFDDNNSTKKKKDDVRGSDRYKFFYFVRKKPQLLLQIEEKISWSDGTLKLPIKKLVNEEIQTVFRDAEIQTIPWEPKHKVVRHEGEEPIELLEIQYLKWNDGLPPGMYEAKMIDRVRIRKAWEKMLKNELDGDVKRQKEIVELMERDEWAHKEEELNQTQKLRMELLEKIYKKTHKKSKTRSDTKIEQVRKRKHSEKEDKTKKLYENTIRDIRKLKVNKCDITKRYHEIDIVTEHQRNTSELFAPTMRYGPHPKRWHTVIDKSMKTFKSDYLNVENLITLPKTPLPKNIDLNERCLSSKIRGTRLCMRQTKWTTPILQELYEEFKVLDRVPPKIVYSLRTRKPLVIHDLGTPEVEGIPDSDEEIYQAAIMLQSILRGRSSQMSIYEGRDRCRELITDLKYSHGLLKEQKEIVHRNQVNMQKIHRNEMIEYEQESRIIRLCDKTEGNILGVLFDFLHKELKRCLQERSAHALCLLIDKERRTREAAEAGRRQKEIRRRKEHDEIYKQISKVQQEIVNIYMNDIINEVTQIASETDAKIYIEKVAKKIDEQSWQTTLKTLDLEEEDELISNMVHYFVLPEVEKSLMINKIKQQQKDNLKYVHEDIYTEIEELKKT